jgi:mannose-6-phosphate isomerase-like protein (cupin superfamily)
MFIADNRSHNAPLVTDTGELITEIVGRGVTPHLDPQHSLAKIILPAGKSSKTHYHKKLEETYYILAGEGSMVVNGEKYKLFPGDVCYLAPGDVHRIENNKAGDLVFLAICNPAWLAEDSFEV